jgi:DNA polymerase III subunit delta'
MASLMALVIGHNEQKQMLAGSQLPHAMVFAGPNGVGKMKLAMAQAQKLICEHRTGCGVCGSCLRVEKNQSENLRVIAPSGPQIKIDQVREVLEFLSFASGGQNRVVILDQAHTMNSQAANSLLKTLEEPPENVFFILITPDVRLLMPTIRSRSQIVSFHSLSVDDLKKIEPGLPAWMYKSARGQAGKLSQFQDGEALNQRNTDLSFFEHFWTNEKFIIETQIKEFAKDRTTAGQILKHWYSFTRDLLVLAQGERDSVLNSDQLSVLMRLDFISVEKLYDFSHSLQTAIYDIDKLDLTLLFETLWVKHARR